jgi:heme exporter protein D
MYFGSLAELWAMDGHGAFVWSAYFIVAMTLVLAMYLPIARHRQTVGQVRRRVQRESITASSTS